MAGLDRFHCTIIHVQYMYLTHVKTFSMTMLDFTPFKQTFV